MLRTPGRRAIVFVLVTVLLDTIGFGMIVPVLPALIVHLTGEPLTRAATYGGWLAFVYASLQFVCAPVLGNLSDRFGRRPVLLAGLALMVVSRSAVGLDIAGFLCGVGIAGTGFGILIGVVARATPPQKRIQRVGLVAAVGSIGTVVLAPTG